MIFKIDDLSKIVNQDIDFCSKTLVVFDVDDVLFEPSDQILRSQHYDEVKKFEDSIDKRYQKNIADELYSIIWMQRKIKSIDKQMVSWISYLQSRKIKVIALTNCVIGRFGRIESVENWRIQELKSLGYNFDKSWTELESIDFYHKNKDSLERYACFKAGIIFTNNVSKAQVLEVFLEHLDLNPRHIIFIDDLLTHLISVENMCEKLGIQFTGIEYSAVAASKIESLDIALGKLQFDTLEKEKKWISDMQAATLIEFIHSKKNETK